MGRRFVGYMLRRVGCGMAVVRLYDCANRDRCGPQWLRWKEQGRCQHDSHADERCNGCQWQRAVSTAVPQDGTGGLRKTYNNDNEDDGS